MPALGITVVRANGQSLTISPRLLGKDEVASVNLIEATTLPGMNGCFARAKVGRPLHEGVCLLFEPDYKALGPSGVSAFESAITVDREGYALYLFIINPRCACAVRVTVVGFVILSVK